MTEIIEISIFVKNSLIIFNKKMTELKQPLKENKKIDRKLINQAEIARRTGYSEAMVSLVLNGKRKNDKLMQKIIEIVQKAA